MVAPGTDAEAELEAFRQRWRQEVSARNKPSSHTSPGAHQRPESFSNSKASSSKQTSAPSRGYAPIDYSDEIEPRAYHDLPNKEESLQLETEGPLNRSDTVEEPVSALEHYERAVERESQGQLGDSVRHYRKAFKVCWKLTTRMKETLTAMYTCSWTRISMRSTRRNISRRRTLPKRKRQHNRCPQP